MSKYNPAKYVKRERPDIPPRNGHQVRNNSQPTIKHKKLLNVTIAKARGGLEPEKAIRQAVTEVYQPNAEVSEVLAQTGLQTLIRETEKVGINDKTVAKRLSDGLFQDDLRGSLGWTQLFSRLKYPEAFRATNNYDQRTLNVFDSLSSEQLSQYVKDKTEQLSSQ